MVTVFRNESKFLLYIFEFNLNNMKQSEKLDIILKELYQYRFDGKYYDIGGLLNDLNIDFEPYTELRMLGKRLVDDGLIKTIWVRQGPAASLTSRGIDYCEETSYSYNNSPIVNNNYNISILNSNNSNIIASSNNITINYNHNQITGVIDKIKEAINNEEKLLHEEKIELIECVEEVHSVIKQEGTPKTSYKALLENTSNFAGIGSLVLELGKLIFGAE